MGGPRPGHASSRDAGFSVVELVVASALAAILLAVAAPSVSTTLDAFRLRGAVRNVVAELHRARGLAVMQNNPQRFWILDAHTYAIHDDDDADGIVDPSEAVTRVDIRTDSPGIMLESAGVATFVPNGSATGGVTISVTNLRGQRRDVVLSGVGRIRVQ